MSSPKNVPALSLAAIFALSGALHLVKPRIYEPIVPEVLGSPRRIVVVSGVAELLCSAGLLVAATRRPAAWASAALLVAVFPANIKMAADSWHGRSAARKWISVARLPLQLPLLAMAWRAGRR